MLFLEYSRCTTTKKARKWLEENGFEFTARDIKEDNPTKEELLRWHEKSGLPWKRFFNTSGQLYRQMGIKEKLADMTEEEIVDLLASDGLLVKRPILEDGDTVLVGFKESEYETLK